MTPVVVWYDIEYDKLRMFLEGSLGNALATSDERMVRLGYL